MTARWADAQRILAIRLDAAGDVLMTSPAIRALKEAHPDRHVTLLTSPAGAAAGRLIPAVDAVIEYVSPWMKPPSTPEPDAHLAMVERLRAERFDAAVIFTVYSQNPLPAAMLAYLAGIPLRLAYCRENPYGLLTDWVPETEPERELRHEVRRQLDLVATVGAVPASERLEARVPPSATKRVSALLEGVIDFDRPWAVLHAGASAASRRYPPERYAEVVRTLSGQHGWQFVFTGEPSEASFVEEAHAGSAGLSLVGQLELDELAALIQRAPLLISNNTGPAHLAAAVGTPVVDLYALTNPQHAPWMVPHRLLFRDVPCAPCYRSVCPEGHQACLTLVPPSDVVGAALDLAAQTGSLPGLCPSRRPALLVDSDGVLFETEGLHLRAVLRSLDALRATLDLPPHGTLTSIYREQARGRDRYEGMALLLAAVGVHLDRGTPDDAPGAGTVCALANLKDEAYRDLLDREGAPVMRGARDLLRTARERGFRIGVVSSSRHARRLLEQSGLVDWVDAIVAPPFEVAMPAKPDPGPYRSAMEALDVNPKDCVVIEDAPSGIASAHGAGAARVIGLAPTSEAAGLLKAGAREVVDVLGRLLLLAPPLRNLTAKG